MQAMCTPMHLIMKASPASQSYPAMGALYLGSLSATMEKSILHEHKITHLVQVLDVPWLPITEKDGFECYRIDILDIPSANLKVELEGACKDIDNALRRGQNVLVHCQQVSLPPSISASLADFTMAGGVSQRGCSNSVPHQASCHVVRFSILLRQKQAAVYQT